MKKFSILLICFVFFCCNEEKSITVTGCITDSITKKPISNAKVTILCWYEAGWDKTDYQNVDTLSNSNGLFKVTFDEGYKVSIASVANGYNISMREFKRGHNKNIKLDISLKRDSLNCNVSDLNLRQYIVNKGSN